MFGRFFAFEMGCPEDDTYVYMNDDGSMSQDPDMQDQESSMICECRGLGCNKCKKKKAKIITLTGNPSIPLPVMNMPMGPGGPSMIMMGRPRFF